jgi:ribosomal protein L37E
MATNPLRREGGYWKPVLDYEHWDESSSASSYSQPSGSVAGTVDRAVRHDLCRHCGSEFVVDSPYCRMCGRARDDAPRVAKSRWQVLDFYHLRRALGLTIGGMVCFIAGVLCVIAAIVTGFLYTANTFTDWQAIQIWRAQWLIAAGVAFLCGVLLNSRRRT